MKLILHLLLSLLLLPILLIRDVFKSKRNVFAKIGWFLLSTVIFSFIWVSGFFSIYKLSEIILFETGLVDRPIEVPTRGTSMTPTIRDGSTVTLYSPQKHGLERGDIISFTNQNTAGKSYLKRLIGVAGDEISIEDGLVIINGQVLNEPYTYKNDPTFGNVFLAECSKVTVPEGKVFAMGDNRAVSYDSRAIGFVDVADIDGVLKPEQVPTFGNKSDRPVVSKSQIDVAQFVARLNKKRAANGVRDLQLQPKLSVIANARVKAIQKDVTDWKTTAPKIADLANDRDYQYLTIQEMITFGNLTETQLVDQIAESYAYKDDFLLGNFYEIGIAQAEVKNNSCTYPVISVVIGLPTVPTYSNKDFNSWSKEVAILSASISALQQLKNHPSINPVEANALIEELSSLLSVAQNIEQRIAKNEVLTQAEYQDIDDYYQKAGKAGEKLMIFYGTYVSVISEPEYQQLLEQVVPEPDEVTQLSYLAMYAYSQGAFDLQLAAAQEMLSLAGSASQKADALHWSGLAYYGMGKTGLAEAELRQSINYDANNAEVYNTLATISYGNQQFAEGLQYSLKCAELAANNAWCYNNQGLGYMYLENKDGAVAALEKAVQLEPNSFLFSSNLQQARNL